MRAARRLAQIRLDRVAERFERLRKQEHGVVQWIGHAKPSWMKRADVKVRSRALRRRDWLWRSPTRYPRHAPTSPPCGAVHAPRACRTGAASYRFPPAPRRRRDSAVDLLSLIHISEPTRLGMISYAVF